MTKTLPTNLTTTGFYIPYRGHEINPQIFTEKYDAFFAKTLQSENSFILEVLKFATDLTNKSENQKRLLLVKLMIDFEVEMLIDRRTKIFRRFNAEGVDFGKYPDYSKELNQVLELLC